MFILVTVVSFLVLLAMYLIYTHVYSSQKGPGYKRYQPEEVGDFYNKQTPNFLKVYGEVIQAFRTTDIKRLLDYQINSMGLQEGQLVLDAGCGVCGPARYFAKQTGAQIEAITISSEQVKRSQEYILNEGLQKKIHVKVGDFHRLPELFPPSHFDLVYFLESFGHASHHARVITSAWEVLKPGGTLYIKDLFIKETPLESLKPKIEQEIRNINTAYRYNVADLYHTLKALRKTGFIISFIKTIDLALEDFENLSISNEFQELTGINKIDNLKDYIFPVDFFEIKCIKPWNPLETGNNRYFLQNLYHLQILNKKTSEL